MADKKVVLHEKVAKTEKKKLMNLMVFWLFSTFVLVSAATLATLAIVAALDVWAAVKAAWPIWLVTALICVVFYFVYKTILDRRD
ncbi:MAG: hypothetical protein JW750_12005 [Anaerolineaceae bacterium]|nr:hypothetical protein [Anaerolineaceae bacterium]